MSRYIDADRLLADLPKLCHSINEGNNCRACPLFNAEDDMCMVEDFIHSQPDAERKKGEWIDGHCSICGERPPFWSKSFCYNCGADMRKETPDEKTIPKS